MGDENKNEANVNHVLHFIQLIRLLFDVIEIVNEVSKKAGPDVIHLVNANFSVNDALDP